MKPLEVTNYKSSVLCIRQLKQSTKKTIVIIGVERGGTSMVAGVIRALGVNLGEHAGRNHEDPNFQKDDEVYLLNQIKINNSHHDIWGFKYPKASLKVDFYSKQLRNPHFILVFRNIASIVDSELLRSDIDPLKTINRSLHYYSEATNYLIKNKYPLLLVNYERACANKFEFIQKISKFTGLALDKNSVETACAVITGDGGGYIDIPEYYFHVETLKLGIESDTVYHHSSGKITQYNGKFIPKNSSDLLIISSKKDYFPKEFFVKFKLSARGMKFVKRKYLSVFFDFTNSFFSGHSYAPEIRNGINTLKILNNGKVKRISFGSLHQNTSYIISEIECFSNDNNLSAELTIKNINEYRVTLYIKIKRIIRPLLNKFNKNKQ